MFNYVFLVLSFYPSLTANYIFLSRGIATQSGIVASFTAVEEDHDWTAYARGLVLMLGLSRFSSQLQGLGQFDIVSGGRGDTSSWSKILLGWINDSQVQSFATPPIGHIVALHASGGDGTGTLALSIGPSGGTYLIEARESAAYDRNNLPSYGVVVIYAPADNSSLQVKTILQPDSAGTAVFLDTSSDFSVIVLNQTQVGFRLLVGAVRDGREAQRALYAIANGKDAIQRAEVDNRIEGLDLARRLLVTARALLTIGRFSDAEPLAISAATTANSAAVPPDYSTSLSLINEAERLKGQSPDLVSGQGRRLVALANDRLDAAKQAFVDRNFTLAKQFAQNAIDLFNNAKQVDLTERILGWLRDLALLISIAVFAYALRYQLKSG